MELQHTLEDREFPDKFQNIINKIDLEKANNFVKAMLNTIVATYGLQNLANEVQFDNSNTKINTHLTHIIEVGGLKIIADNKLNVQDRQNFQNIIVSVAFILNCSLAIELRNLKVYNGDTSNYYNNDAILTIIQRLANHTINGMSYSDGFEDYSTKMILNNLIGKMAI